MNKKKTSTLAILGAKWVTLGIVSQKICQIIVVVILVRLLTPEDFGLVAIATMTLNVVSSLKVLGMTSALIRRKDDIQRAANAFFFLNCILTVLLFGSIFVASPYIAAFFKNDTASLVLKIMSLQLFIEAASVVQNTLTIKELEFKKQTVITLCGSGISGIISIVLALKGFGVWSLVYGPLTGGSIASVLWWFFCQWRPKLSFNLEIAKEMLRFGLYLFTASTLDKMMITCNRIFIGRFLGIMSIGFYDLTNQIIYLPSQNIILIGQQVTLPAFCQIQEDTEQIKRWYLKVTGYSCLLMAPIAVCFLLLSDHFVPVIYGEKWLPIIPLIKILALFAFMMPFVHNWSVYVSIGRTDLLLKFTAVRFLVTVSLIYFATQVSLFAVCLVELISICIFASVNLYIVMKLIKIPLEQLISIIRIPLMGTVSFALTLLIFRHLSLYLFNTPNLISLVIIVLPTFASYILTLYFRHPEMYYELKNLVGVSLRQEKVLSVSKDTPKKQR